MENLFKYAFDTGAINNVILSVIVLSSFHFFTFKWWPGHSKRADRQQEINRELRLHEIDSDREIKRLEIEAQIDIYKKVIGDMESIETSIIGLRATFNDFLQNILSQLIDDRKDSK